MKRSCWVLVVALCLAFALRAVLLIDATALWSDELYSVGKSFQPSYAALLAMLPPVAVVVIMQKLFVKGLIESEK